MLPKYYRLRTTPFFSSQIRHHIDSYISITQYNISFIQIINNMYGLSLIQLSDLSSIIDF